MVILPPPLPGDISPNQQMARPQHKKCEQQHHPQKFRSQYQETFVKKIKIKNKNKTPENTFQKTRRNVAETPNAAKDAYQPANS